MLGLLLSGEESGEEGVEGGGGKRSRHALPFGGEHVRGGGKFHIADDETEVAQAVNGGDVNGLSSVGAGVVERVLLLPVQIAVGF